MDASSIKLRKQISGKWYRRVGAFDTKGEAKALADRVGKRVVTKIDSRVVSVGRGPLYLGGIPPHKVYFVWAAD